MNYLPVAVGVIAVCYGIIAYVAIVKPDYARRKYQNREKGTCPMKQEQIDKYKDL